LRRIQLLACVLAALLGASVASAQAPYAPYGYLQPAHGHHGHWQYTDVQAAALEVIQSAPLAAPCSFDGPKPAYGAMVIGQTGIPGCAQDVTPIHPAPCHDQACGQLPNCEPMCEPMCKPKHCCFVGGAGVYYLRPYWESNPAFSTSVASGIGPVGGVVGNDFVIQNEEDFDYDYKVAPYAWVGYVSESGLGVRARGFYYDYNANSITLRDESDTLGFITAAPLGLGIFTEGGVGLGESLTIDSSLRLMYIDLEVSQQFQVGAWWLLLSGGARWAQISQNYDASLDDSLGDLQTVSLRSGHNFRGFGPTAAFEARRPFYSGFALFGSVRGSVLLGKHRQNAFLRSFDANNDFDSAVLFSSADENTTMPVAELELGLEYGRQIRGARLFVQASVVNHTWFNAGNATNSSSALTSSGTFFDNYFIKDATNDRSDLNLFGAKLVVGINY